jgi:hypothetical protein
MSIDLVIARYKENISWLHQVPDSINTIYIYNKDDTCKRPLNRYGTVVRSYQINPPTLDVPTSRSKIISLPNVGREADTYLEHIIQNYDNLADLTIFSQGDPFPHSPDFMKLLGYTNDYAPVQPLTDRYLDEANMPPKSILDTHTQHWIRDARIYTVPMCNYNFQTLHFHDPGSYVVLEQYMKHFSIPNGINILDWTFKSCGFSIDIKETGYFNYAAIFAVSKDRILQHPLSAYKNLKEMNANGNALCASALERMWLQLFGFEPL